jgi:hypothetical protein
MKSVYTGMMAAVMIAAATLTFTACSSEAEELLLPEVPEQTATDQSYTLTVNASKGEEGTRALSIDGNDIKATWAQGDVVKVYKGDEEVGTLTAQNGGANTTLTGKMTSAPTLDEVLTLKYLSPDYNSQNGTLASIAEKCDYAVATVTVNSVAEGGAISTTDAAFVNQQAIVKFTLKDKNGTEINPTSFSVKYGDASIEINNIPSNTYTTNDAGVLYVAIPGGENKDVVLKANVKSTVYTFMRHGVKFENANYYPINVRMKWDELENPLTFEAKEDGATVTLKVGKYYRSPFPSLQYKIVPQREGESEWTTITIEKEKPISIPLTTGEKVLFKGINTNLSQSSSIDKSFSISVEGDGFVYGNVMSLLYGDNSVVETSMPSNYVVANLFLNNTTIYNHPYKTLVLPAMTLKVSCYSNMFEGCSNLTSAPELPATTMAEACYYSMFKDCTGLTTAPKLPATTLTKGCYNDMFRGCTSLTKAPDLLAEVAVSNCYSGMFRGCSSLNSIKCLLSKYNRDNTYYWLDDVASTGTFYAKSEGIWPTNQHGIPSGWDVSYEQ